MKMEHITENIFNFIIHPQFTGFFLYIKIVFIVVSLILLIAVIILLFKTSWMRYRCLESLTEFTSYRPFGVKKTFKDWNKVIKRLESDRESEYKLAIIEADDLLSSILEQMQLKGESFSQKLEQVEPSVLPNLKEIQEAHEIRNNIVYNPDYKLSLAQTKAVLETYEKALRNLEMF